MLVRLEEFGLNKRCCWENPALLKAPFLLLQTKSILSFSYDAQLQTKQVKKR